MRGECRVESTLHWSKSLCSRAFPAFGVRGGGKSLSCRKTTSCLCRNDDLLKKFPFYFVLSLHIRIFSIKYRREASEEVLV